MQDFAIISRCAFRIPISAKEMTGIIELEHAIKDMFFQGQVSFNDEIYITNIDKTQ